MKCPRCHDVTLLLSERSRIEIDYCPECRGVWLDRGELDKLLERAEGDVDARLSAVASAARRPDRDDDHAAYRGAGTKKKRKSFLSEMFEFGD